MTAKPEDLIQKLRILAFLPDSSEAVDLIEELLAENRRLRGNLVEDERYIAQLREALEEIAENLSPTPISIARRALGPKP